MPTEITCTSCGKTFLRKELLLGNALEIEPGRPICPDCARERRQRQATAARANASAGSPIGVSFRISSVPVLDVGWKCLLGAVFFCWIPFLGSGLAVSAFILAVIAMARDYFWPGVWMCVASVVIQSFALVVSYLAMVSLAFRFGLKLLGPVFGVPGDLPGNFPE